VELNTEKEKLNEIKLKLYCDKICHKPKVHIACHHLASDHIICSFPFMVAIISRFQLFPLTLHSRHCKSRSEDFNIGILILETVGKGDLSRFLKIWNLNMTSSFG